MRFKTIRTIDDVRPFVLDRPEIRFLPQSNGTTIACYMFMDGHTFDAPEALECRGLCFDREGRVCSRPFHKFFNIGEKERLAPENVLWRTDVRITTKLDGSMIATALIDNDLHWRSKKSFESDVVRMAREYMAGSCAGQDIETFARRVARSGQTAIFEFVSPDAQIVLRYGKPAMTLLAVRDNETGEYAPNLHAVTFRHGLGLSEIPTVEAKTGTLAEIHASLADASEMEGYVVQFHDGDMMKMKCPWYIRLHSVVSMLRERDIAELAAREELDDTKAALVEVGIELAQVEAIEARVKTIILEADAAVEAAYAADAALDRKAFAIKHKEHPMFPMLMCRYTGKEADYAGWFLKFRLKDEFSLRSLVPVVAEEV